MEAKIKEIQDYFIGKILAGDFTVVKMDDYTCEILIDEKYPFSIWIKNDAENRKPFHATSRYFIVLEFTEEQCLLCDALLRPIITKYRNEILLVEKKKQFESLRKELAEFNE